MREQGAWNRDNPPTPFATVPVDNRRPFRAALDALPNGQQPDPHHEDQHA